jgi:hypothetical protein
MRRKPLSKMLGFFITVMTLFTSIAVNATVVNAAVTESAATFQNGMLVLTPEGVNGVKTDFFKEYTKNLIPGDEVTFAIKLNNISSERIRFYFWASDTDFGDNEEAKALSNDLLSLLSLKIELPNNEKPLYEGPANGKGNDTVGASKITGTGSSDAISLGWLEAGALSYLQVTITVPTGLGNNYKSSLAAVDWMFLCEIYEVPTTNPPTTDPPTTNPPTTDPPTTEPPIITPPIIPDLIPEEEVDNIDIEEDEIPEGAPDVDITDDGIPQGAIIVDDSNLGKLPQTGTLASIIGNSSGVGSIIFLFLIASSILVFVKSRMKKIE